MRFAAIGFEKFNNGRGPLMALIERSTVRGFAASRNDWNSVRFIDWKRFDATRKAVNLKQTDSEKGRGVDESEKKEIPEMRPTKQRTRKYRSENCIEIDEKIEREIER